MEKTYMLYLYDKYGIKISQYGPVKQMDRTWAHRFALQIFDQQLKRNPGSYIDIEER